MAEGGAQTEAAFSMGLRQVGESELEKEESLSSEEA